MPREVDPIMKQRQLSEINKGLSMVADTLVELDRAENCGAECQQRRDNLEHQRTILNALKREYFPGVI